MRKIFLTLLPLISCFISFAQKDAPVAGHAAQLVDLLKKDYNANDPGIRDEDISRDRTAVIALFKSYLTDPQKKALLSSASFSSADRILNERYTSYIELKEKYDLYSRQDNKTATDINQLQAIFTALKNAKNQYYKSKYDSDLNELAALTDQYASNLFLKDVVNDFIEKYNKLNVGSLDEFASANAASSIQKSIPFIGGDLSFETFIDGLSRFLAKRIKEELTTYVIDKVKKWLQNPSENDPFAELKVLLPRTTGYILSFQASQVTNFVNEIKQYIEDDLNKILPNAAQLRNTPRIKRLLNLHPDMDFAFEALELIPEISKVKHPADYFTFLENSKNINRWRTDPNPVKSNIANTIDLAGLLSRSLLIIDNGESRFAGVDFITSYATESNFFRLYGGFLYQQSLKYYKIRFGSVTLSDKLKDMITATGQFNDWMLNFKEVLTGAAKNAEKIFNTATDIRKANKAGQKIGADTIYHFVESIIGFSEDISTTAESLITKLNGGPLPSGSLFENIKPYFTIAKTTNEIVFDLRRKKYSTALVKSIDISAQLFNNNRFSSITSSISGLSSVKDNADLPDWHNLIQFVNTSSGNTGTITISTATQQLALAAAGQLKKIEIFYRLNFANDQAITTSLQYLSELCNKKLQNSSITGADITQAKTIFGDRRCQKLFVSYFAGIAVDAAVTRMRDEMLELKIKGPGKKDVGVFTRDEVDALTITIDNFVHELYENYIASGNLTETGSLVQVREKMERYFMNYIVALPQKFDIQINPNILLLIHFVNDMASAQSAEDVEKAINAFALPSGSYSIKRKAKSNFAIGSYPGILPAYEISLKPSETLRSFTIGFTAPVGVSYTMGNKKGASWGFFVPVIDVAAITRLRIDESKNTQMLPAFTFKNIVSPGLYVSYGFKNSPISINLGAQYGPELKEITAGDTKSYESFRIGAGLVLDIPLFNLHTSPR